ncbi:hypothetical protein HanRHA438_Chr16g0789151 [Helianthus annuus]|nr:hypothetical protein HanHA89_Chr16g0686051 [Helianthus annuus]KAJ0823714.1 hypothetical protein HanPSC8_Chr16g0746861 [Helianthus annuus]KAJ0838453.1 hypothetical protein HanRHA438_Chr16g0789151 [Helianthus annuus]
MEDDKSLVELLIAQDNQLGEKKSAEEDCKALLEQVNAQEKELRNKRRWLLGLTTFEDQEADDDDDTDEDVKTSNAEFERRHPVPESLLREDDVSYEVIKSSLEKGICNDNNKYHISEDEMQLVNLPRDARGVLQLTKDMTNQGLDRFVEALTDGSVDFAKTRWKMTQMIKEHLSSSSLNKRQTLELSENQLAVLKNPHNYRWSSECRFVPADSDSLRAAVYKILGALEALPTQTLFAMHRKIKGIKHYMPQLIPVKKSGWGRDALIECLRKKSLKLLSKLNEGDSLPEPLAKAMDVAGLSFKLIQGCEFATNFVIQPSPETNALQNEIAKCLKLLDERVELRVLKDIQQALNASGENIADRSLRTLVRNVLTEFLCECGDMEIVPECLRHVLAIIKKSCKACVPHPEKISIEEDVESILSVSASMKQLVWDLIPHSEDEKLDREFADAYMEDLDDSYDDEDEDEDEDISSVSTGYSKCHFSHRMHLMRHHLVRVKIPQQEGHTDDRRRRSTCKNNQYLAVQAATDEASMVAYRLIDHILNDDSGAEEGNSMGKKRKATSEEEEDLEDDGSGSLVLKAVEELLPSFAKKCEGLKKSK